ncbi:MAG TPA: DHH family phosphoesterase [Longimicrobiales bacterium]|nr:DHH family phosphoesterase [Longimicrobiales bacterium]
MPSEPTETNVSRRPLLLLISNSRSVPTALRSSVREVRRWRARGGPDAFGGDPTDPETYGWIRGAPAVTAVIDMQPASRARGVLDALRKVRPDAAVMLLSSELSDVDGPSDGTLARGGRLRDVLRVDVEEELERLEAERRGYCLRQFAAGEDLVPILIHNDPDPDAVSSALAVMKLLDGSPDRTPIVTLDPITRPENRRMAELLRISVTQITRDELMRFDRVITVDTQPDGLQENGRPRFAVIDHHPPEDDYTAEFSDIRPEYGATATMMTEYLRAADDRLINTSLATALLFGIRTDTDTLTRGVTAADVAAYAWLQSRADVQLVRRFERPSYSYHAAAAFGDALGGAEYDDELVVSHLGELSDDESHVLADLADFCLTIENVTWVVVSAVIDGELILTIRHTGTGTGAGTLARAIADLGGDGGGHATMARAVLSLDVAEDLLGGDADAPAVQRLVRRVLSENGAATNRRGLRPAHPV